MKNRENRIISGILVALVGVNLFILPGCKDIVEEDLQDKTVTVISPANDLHTSVLTHTFWWKEVDGALKYELEIVHPSFSQVEKLVLDTNINLIQFQYTLYPGTFEWRVRAYNSSYTTVYTTHTLTIDSTADLSQQQVVLITPSTSFATNQQSVQFQWYELYNADDYRFEIRSPDWNGSLVINPQITTDDNITLTLDEGFYVWGVQAHNATSNSQFSTRTLIVDTTSPSIPVLVYPGAGATVYDSLLSNSTIIFRWQRGSNTGSTISDSLYLSTDSIFSISGLQLSVATSDTTYSHIMQTQGTYYWKVRSKDAAGNKSNYSIVRKFIFEL